MKNLWQHVGLMAVVVFPFGDALAQFCSTVVEGTSGTDGMALCKRYGSGTDQIYVARCTSGTLYWTDVCDSSGTLTDDVTIRGLGGADGLVVISGSYTLAGGCSAITCYGQVDLDVYTVTLEGGGGNDALYSENDTGQVNFEGGTEHDTMLHDNDYAGNVSNGGPGNDTITDAGGGSDYLYGGDNDDCLYAPCFFVMDCGLGDDDKFSWAGASVCCHGEFCAYPNDNCETETTCY